MKNTKPNALIAAALASLTSVPLAHPVSSSARLRDVHEMLATKVLDEMSRQRFERLTTELGSLLERLPLEDLVDVEVAGESIEFVFAFEGVRRIELPSVERKVYDARMRRLREVEIDGETLRIGPRVRFHLIGNEFHLRKGDIEVRKYFCWHDVNGHTETRPSQVVRDERGRPFVELNADGEAMRNEEGHYRYVRTSRWLVLEAKGRTVECALPLSF